MYGNFEIKLSLCTRRRLFVSHPQSFLSPLRNNVKIMRFCILVAVSMKMTVFWDIVPCSLVEVSLKVEEVVSMSEMSVNFCKSTCHKIKN
jgi:hypothetical protein